jgi:parallel beta-helix repeat protein
MAGTYLINSTISSSGSNVELYGQGNGTILKLNNGVNVPVVSLSQVSNWFIHDLQIDGNKANQSQVAAPPGSSASNYPALNCYGITLWRATGTTIANCYIHDCRCSGINISASSGCSVASCLIMNSDANGITIDNAGGGGDCVVSGNTVDGASDVGITAWNGVHLTVTSNTVRNINLNTSPYSENTHVGIMLEGPSGCNSCAYTNNAIQNCGVALCSDPHAGTNTNTIFNSNTATMCQQGAYINKSDTITLNNNTFNGITSPTGYGIEVAQYVTNATITNNIISNVISSLKPAIIILIGPSGTLTGNTIHNDGKLTAIWQNPLKLPGWAWTIQNNTIVP